MPSVLANLDIELTDKQLEALMRGLPFDGESLAASHETVSVTSFIVLTVSKSQSIVLKSEDTRENDPCGSLF